MAETTTCAYCGNDITAVLDTARASEARLREALRPFARTVNMRDRVMDWFGGGDFTEAAHALSGSSGEWLEKKIADAIAEKFSQERSMVCTYCGHKTVGEGLSAEDFDAKWKQHMLYCEARPEVKLLNALCYIADKYGVPDDSEPEVMKSARDWLARQLADAKREALEAAAERIESIFGVGISGAPEELRQMAQEVPNA